MHVRTYKVRFFFVDLSKRHPHLFVSLHTHQNHTPSRKFIGHPEIKDITENIVIFLWWICTPSGAHSQSTSRQHGSGTPVDVSRAFTHKITTDFAPRSSSGWARQAPPLSTATCSPPHPRLLSAIATNHGSGRACSCRAIQSEHCRAQVESCLCGRKSLQLRQTVPA